MIMINHQNDDNNGSQIKNHNKTDDNQIIIKNDRIAQFGS